MQFNKGELYHIYNRGNNHDRVFYSHENYLYFLCKIEAYIKPYADIIAWCLMPNHFHIMVYVNEVSLSSGSLANKATLLNGSLKATLLNESLKATLLSGSLKATRSMSEAKERTLNQSIGIMLRSYTNAIQKQEHRTGALFQEETKAILLTENIKLTPAYYNTAFGSQITVLDDTKSYEQLCFNYIHQNPVAAKLVLKPEDWPYSSYQDYLGIRNGKLIDRERGKEFFEERSGLHKETRLLAIDPVAKKANESKTKSSSGLIHNFELSLHHEHEQAAKADAFYWNVLHATDIKRFNSGFDEDMEFQRQDVDVLITLNGINYRVSEKFRDKDYGDMYLEVYSKYPKTVGWLHTGSPNAILYFTPNAVYWITHKSLTSFCFTKLFPLIPEDWYLDIFLSHKPFISKQIILNQQSIKVNLIQAHNSLPDGSHWETIGITIAFEVLEQHGVQIRKYANV